MLGWRLGGVAPHTAGTPAVYMVVLLFLCHCVEEMNQSLLVCSLTSIQVIAILEKNRELSEDFMRPVWDLWAEDVSEEEYREHVAEPMDLKTLSKRLDKGRRSSPPFVVVAVAQKMKALWVRRKGCCCMFAVECEVYSRMPKPIPSTQFIFERLSVWPPLCRGV